MSYRGSDAAVARAMVAQYGGGKKWFTARDGHYGGVWVGAEYSPVSSDLRGNISFVRRDHKSGKLGEDTLPFLHLGNQLEGWYDAELDLRDFHGGLIDICKEELRAERAKDDERREQARKEREELIAKQERERLREVRRKKAVYDKRELETLEKDFEELLKDKAVQEAIPSTGYENNEAYGSW